MGNDLFDRFNVIDVDSHLTEPPDVWTARVPASRRDEVPHIERIDGQDVWMVKGERLGAPGYYSMAGHDGIMPASIPQTYDDIAPAMYDPVARLRFLDEQGIRAQVLYPNVGGFGNGYFLRLGDRELVAQCVMAYNDFLTDWTSADPDRLVAITALPFWDIELSIAEMQRCHEAGHKAINFCNQPQDYGQPPLAHEQWDPIWAAAQELGISVSFHVGGGSMGTQFVDTAGMGWMTNFAKVSSLIFMDNMRCIGDLIFGGVCHRFPDLTFVSVESGVGWLPSALETFDWQWRNGGVRTGAPRVRPAAERVLPSPDLRLLLVRARVRARGDRALPGQHHVRDRLPAPDLPAPRPAVAGGVGRATTRRACLGKLPDSVLSTVLHDNAAAIYRLP